ncbi:MAG: hypothetical protein ACM65M_11025 [Microcoleus sp.]
MNNSDATGFDIRKHFAVVTFFLVSSPKISRIDSSAIGGGCAKRLQITLKIRALT